MLCVVGAGGAVSGWQARFPQYPGRVHSVTRRVEEADWSTATLAWQITYWTDAPLERVRDWYAPRVGPAPVWSDTQASGACIMLSHADLVFRLEHTVAVVICDRPRGTRVVVTDVLRLLR